MTILDKLFNKKRKGEKATSPASSDKPSDKSTNDVEKMEEKITPDTVSEKDQMALSVFLSFLQAQSTLRFQNYSISSKYTAENPATVGAILSWLFPDGYKCVRSMSIMSMGKDGQTGEVSFLTDAEVILSTRLLPLVRHMDTLLPKTGENVALSIKFNEPEHKENIPEQVILFLRGCPGGLDGKSACMRVSIMVPSCGHDEDGRAARQGDSLRISEPACPQLQMSFLIEETFNGGDLSAEMALYEEKLSSTLEVLKEDKNFEDQMEFAVYHGVYESQSTQDLINIGVEGLKIGWYMFSLRSLLRAYMRMNSLPSSEKDEQYHYAAACIGKCLHMMGAYDEALYYLLLGSKHYETAKDIYHSMAMMADVRAKDKEENDYEDQKVRLQYEYSGRYNCQISVGFVFRELFRAPEGSLKSMLIDKGDGSEKVFISNPADTWNFNFRSLLDNGTTVMFRYSPGLIETDAYQDKSERCMDTSFVMYVRKAETGYDDGLMRVSIMMPNFIGDDDKFVIGDANIPEGITFLASRETMLFRTIGDSEDRLSGVIDKLEGNGRFLEALHAARYEFFKLHTRAEQADEDQTALWHYYAYKVGYYYNEFSEPERASYYLRIAADSWHVKALKEYVNSMANSKSPTTIELIDVYLNLEPDNENDEEYKELITFLKRRKAYILIDDHRLDEAEQLLNEIATSSDEGTKEFVKEELKYIQDLREKKDKQK